MLLGVVILHIRLTCSDKIGVLISNKNRCVILPGEGMISVIEKDSLRHVT